MAAKKAKNAPRLTFRPLKSSDVVFTIAAELDPLDVRGNAMASGDDVADRECEDAIIARVNSGDVWAWACVTVTATWEGFEASDVLGACSYADEADFKAGGYYADMKEACLHTLNAQIKRAGSRFE
jgi:hypothetical protein